MQTTPAIGRGVRNSNIEFLRIMSMLMVLMLHVNFFSLGSPTTEEMYTQPLQTFGRVTFEMFCIIAVNLFVFISGWFSIKIKKKGFAKFLFQCVFILTAMYVIGLVTGWAELTPGGILDCFFLIGNAWFVTSYIGLYILSPFLNSYCEKASEKQLRYILILFFTFQTIYGNIIPYVSYIAGGYSTFSFIGLYLLARYMRLYGQKLHKYGLTLYIVSIVGLIAWYYAGLMTGMKRISDMAMAYTCPLNITATAGLVIWIAGMKPRTNKFVNFIAASVFSVYLCHICNGWTMETYRDIAEIAYNYNNGFNYFIRISVFIIFVFIFAILLDQPRKWVWYLILKGLSRFPKLAF